MVKKDSIAMLEAKIELLTRARKKFKEGDYPGICSTIYGSFVWYKEPELEPVADALCNYIQKVLGDCAYLNQWLWKNQPYRSTSIDNMKQYRLQWIDWMISSLKEDLAQKSKTRR